MLSGDVFVAQTIRMSLCNVNETQDSQPRLALPRKRAQQTLNQLAADHLHQLLHSRQSGNNFLGMAR